MTSMSAHAGIGPFWRRLAAASVPITVAAFIALGSAAPGSAAADGPAFKALSGGVLTSLAYHQGLVVPGRGTAQPSVPNPVILPNVQVSNTGGSPNNEVPVAVNPLDSKQLESGANDYDCSNSLQGFFNSDDGGATWPHQTCMSILSGKVGFGDPNVAYDRTGINGTAYILGIQATGSLTNAVIAYEKSTNNGMSWSAVQPGPTSFYANGFTDKEWTEVDHSLTSPFLNCIYVSITQFDSTFNDETITVDHSCNGGTTWSGPKAVSAQAVFPIVRQFSDLAIGTDGTIYASWLMCVATGPAGDCGGTTATIEFSKSTDGGNTWSVPIPVHTVKLAPDSCFCAFYGNVPTTSERTSEIPVIDADSGITLYLSDYDYTPGFMQLRVTKSTDGGATWGAPVIVYPSSTRDQFLPWLSVDDATGYIWVTYLLRNAGNYGEKVARSVNLGVSYQGNVFIATVPSAFVNDGFGGGFMGDYTGNIWTGTCLYAVWPDTRTGVAQDEGGGVC